MFFLLLYFCFGKAEMIAKAAESPAASMMKSPFGDEEFCMIKIRAMIDNIHNIVLVVATIDSVRD